ncbi:MAG: type VI secretion system baseplate subunit TssE [Candidatus Parabeggiatoa sp.]|nr:type VI secretion system baseplate subunit TssE [Candidatus Parabeggiatoa sp.]
MRQRETYARASLLDRLVDLEPQFPQEAHPLRAQTPRALRASVRRDLEWLFNTRCPLPEAELAQRQRSVIDYGVMDFGTFFTHNQEDFRRLAQHIEQTIGIYEPRLKESRVTVTLLRGSHRALQVILDAQLIIDDINEPVSFPIIIDTKRGGEVKILSDD